MLLRGKARETIKNLHFIALYGLTTVQRFLIRQNLLITELFIKESSFFDGLSHRSEPLRIDLKSDHFKSNGGYFLKTINLRDYYPHYKEDEFYEVPDAVADLLDEFERREEAYRIYTLRYKAYYSLEADDGIEKSILLTVPSPNEVLEQERKRAFPLSSPLF